MSDIREFQITWKRELFFKNKSTLLTAKCLIKKYSTVQTRSSQQLNYLITVHKLNKSLAKYLHERLQILQNEIDNYNHQIKNLIEQEKDYWKQFANIIEKRTNSHQQPKSESTSSKTRSIIMRVDKNNENIPPLECKDYNKKTRKKKKCLS